jgi:hypothetical protein
MKALLLFPGANSIAENIEHALMLNGINTERLNFRTIARRNEEFIDTQIYRFPDKVRRVWEAYYLKKINHWYRLQFEKQRPDLVFIYNNELLLPETLAWLRQKKIIIAFFLGDHPLYTFTSRYNLAVLDYADAVFVPDTFWQQQLQKMGLPQVHHLVLPLPQKMYYPIEQIPLAEASLLATDALYVGLSYKDSWGYKKARFLSYFTHCKLQIHGNEAWKRWFAFFPELEPCFIARKTLIPAPQLNKMYNCAKIIPVDGNPGIFNGIHLRASEALASGTLPLMEWNADIDLIFSGLDDLPAVKDYRAIPEMVSFYLAHENIRKELIEQMSACYQLKYGVKSTGAYLLRHLGLASKPPSVSTSTR